MSRLAEVEEANFKDFSLDMLLTTCILSGCDYLESIKGIGFKKAHKLVKECCTGGTLNSESDIQRVLKFIRREGKLLVPANYEKTFEKALLTFKFQRVFCPQRKHIVHLHNPETHKLGSLLKNYASLDFLGSEMEEDMALKIARGEIDPMSHKPYMELGGLHVDGSSG
jgi:exonuclease-1